jgi:hypothetical protein
VNVSSQEWRERLAPLTNNRCGYCLTQQAVSGIPLTLEHIIPQSKGGQTYEENLWLSCRICNENKGVLTDFIDSESGSIAPLFNPRTQTWSEHFTWNDEGTLMIGLTSIGRATINALDLNSNFRVRSRSIWVEAGWHPPGEP